MAPGTYSRLTCQVVLPGWSRWQQTVTNHENHQMNTKYKQASFINIYKYISITFKNIADKKLKGVRES